MKLFFFHFSFAEVQQGKGKGKGYHGICMGSKNDFIKLKIRQYEHFV